MAATARLDLRMSAEDKNTITHAANVRGLPVAAFVRLAALREAEAVAAEAATLPTGQAGRLLATRLKGRATAHLSTDEIMKLTRGT